jgi:predicted phosphodiesterase
MLEIFPRVKVMKVPGNHGRTTSQPISEDATNSFEYLLGQLLIERFRDNKRVEIIVPNTYHYTTEIRGHKYLLFHGNTIKGTTLNSIERAVKDLATLSYKEFYDVMIIGHFHTALKLTITPRTILLVNGCWIYMDDFAYTKLRKFSSVTQYLFNISKKSPLHNSQEICLDWK